MRLIALVLRIASLVLPSPYRVRWREEALAVLAEVHGWRRWRYALDTAVKVPLVARECRVDLAAPPRWQLDVAGFALLAAPALVFAGMMLLRDEYGGTDRLAYLLPAFGVVPAVAIRSAHLAAGTAGYCRAVALTVLAVTAPTAALFLDDFMLAYAVAMAVPNAWLVTVGLTALARRIGPADQATLGVITGLIYPFGLLGLLSSRLIIFGFFLLVILFNIGLVTIWSVLAGLRLVVGRPDLVLRNPPT